MTSTTESLFLTPDELAAMLSVTKRTLRNLTAKGLIPTVKITAKIVRYPRAAIISSLEKLTVGAGK